MRIFLSDALRINNLNVQKQKKSNNSIPFGVKFCKGDTFELTNCSECANLSQQTSEHFKLIQEEADIYIKEYKDAEVQENARGKVRAHLSCFLPLVAGKINIDSDELYHLVRGVKVKPRDVAVKAVDETNKETNFGLDKDSRNGAIFIVEKTLNDILSDEKILDAPLQEVNSNINRQIEESVNTLHWYSFGHEPFYPFVWRLRNAINQRSESFAEFPQNFSSGVKAVVEQCCVDKIQTLENGNLIINNDKIQEVLRTFSPEAQHYTLEEIINAYGVKDVKKCFPDCMVEVIEVDGIKVPEDKKPAYTIVSFPKNSLSEQIKFDLDNKRIAPLEVFLEESPFVALKKYSYSENGEQVDCLYADLLDNDYLQLKKLDAQTRRLMATLPFKYTKNGEHEYVDIKNKYNSEVLKSASSNSVYPTPSEYYINRNSNSSCRFTDIKIPIAHLEELGFARQDVLSGLIKDGKLSGSRDSNGNEYVEFTIDKHGKPHESWLLLVQLRDKNKAIMQFKDVAKSIGISQKRLEMAVLLGEFEIIKQHIAPVDRAARYVNITTPKNQEFIRKIKFEQTLEKTIKNQKRLENKEARIQKQDLRQRLAAIRMALVWEFMPNTKHVASMLAKSDGSIAKLLEKDDDPAQELTNIEEAKLNAYRKQMWMMAGTEELKFAHQKAAQIMKAFKEGGLGAVDSEYLPIFERYGFTK